MRSFVPRTFALIAILLATRVAYPASLDDANQAFKAGDYAKAMELVEEHLSRKPKDAQGRFLKGLILTKLEKKGEAIAVFRKLTEDYPELPAPYNNLAVIYAQQKQYEKARKALEQAIRTHPAYAIAHENLGDIYSLLAGEAYKKALSIDTSNVAAQAKLAMINELFGAPRETPGAAPIASAAKMANTNPVGTPSSALSSNLQSKSSSAVIAEQAKVETILAKSESREVPDSQAGSLDAQITATVDDWLAMWSRKDIAGYLAHYAPDFETPNGLSRKAWEAERTLRVGKPGPIKVTRGKLTTKIEASDRVTVRFRQDYRSASFNSSSYKTLTLVRRDGKWLIIKEKSG